VLEDDPGIRRLERLALARAGYDVALAGNIREARDHLAKSDIQILILDYRLEDNENGLEFYRELQCEGRDVPAILVTGFGDEQRIVEAMRAGVRDFIPKTPNFVDLVPATVERVFAQVRQERRLKEAENASRAKDDFLAALSHELRTPLTPVMALVSELRRNRELPREVLEDLETIHRNISLESRLIDDLLDLTRITRGKLELRGETTDLRGIIDHAVKTSFAGEELLKSVEYSEEIPEAPLPVRVDPARITQVLWNLLTNAMKFTPEGGRITLSVRVEESGDKHWAAVDVTDTGIGIDSEVLPQIFGAFEQGSRSITRRFGGLGLGLAISKAIMELHGGSISATSPGLGKGATFSVRLPLAKVGAIEAESRLAAPAEIRHRPEERPAHLLLVEDHRDTSAIMARMLRRAGFHVTAASGVNDALRKMEAAQNQETPASLPIRLVVSDLGLPDGSGFDVMLALQKKYRIRGIALSGYGMEEDIRRSHAAGFARHLTKPVDFDCLIGAIREVLEPE